MTTKLSKTTFVRGNRCLKWLYLHVHEPKIAAKPEDVAGAIIQQGREVGLLARKLFPGGVEIPSDSSRDEAIRATRELVANPDVLSTNSLAKFRRRWYVGKYDDNDSPYCPPRPTVRA